MAEEEKNLDLKQVSGKISYGKWEISYRIFEKEECRCQIPKKTYTKWFDYGIIKQSVAVRTRRAGDFIVIDGSGGRQKLKSYFINKKIPVAERTGIPLIAEGTRFMDCGLPAEQGIPGDRADNENIRNYDKWRYFKWPRK